MEKEKKSREITGTKIVISGALASMVLWLTILAIGSPIKSFSNSSTSFVYAVGITLPVIVLSIAAILRARKSTH